MALAATALVSASCSRLQSSAHGQPVVLGENSTPYSTVPALATAFIAAYPSVHFASVWPAFPIDARPSPLPSAAKLLLTEWDAGGATNPYPPGAHNLALDTLVRTANFDLRSLAPGSVAARTVGGHLLALTWSQVPLVVAWRPDVFHAAGISPPGSSWDWNDFTAVCTDLQAFVGSSQMPSLHGVIPPQFLFYHASAALKVLGLPSGLTLESPLFWMAFVKGFGGSVTSDGTFAFDAGALAGLNTYVSLVRRFASPTPIPPQAAADQYAMTLTAWQPPAARFPSSTEWAYARLPRFPIQPVITTELRGVGLASLKGRVPPGRDLNAAVEALRWLYTNGAQGLIGDYGYVPALDDQSVQGAFWSRMSPTDQSAGEWANFVPWSEGWPAIPPYTLALAAAIQEPGQLESVVGTYEREANGWLQQQLAT